MPDTETMHEDYIKAALSSKWPRATCTNATLTLKEMCLQTTRLHMNVLDKSALDLPTSLLKDLLPHLNIVDLDRIHEAVKLKGISTSYVWAGMLRDFYAKENAILTEDEWKQKAMEKLFTLMFYGYKFKNVKRYLSNVNFQSLLLTMAKYVLHLSLQPSHYIVSFTAELWPVLSVLEKGVRRVQVSNCNVSEQDAHRVLYVLHRILDHGIAQHVIIDQNTGPSLLAWILHGRGPQSASHTCPLESMHGEMATCFSTNIGTTSGNTEAANCQVSEKEELSEDEEDHGTPCKQRRLSLAATQREVKKPSPPCRCMDHERLCRMFNPSAGPTRVDCPRGRIQSLEIWRARGEVFNVLFPLLPSWLCLCSLSLHSGSCRSALGNVEVFEERDVLRLAQSLKKLYETSRSSLTDLSVSTLPHPSLMESLLNACPNLRSFSMEIHPIAENHRPQQRLALRSAGHSELLLENLSVKLPKVRTNLEGLSSVLKRSPNLTSLHVEGIQSSRGFSLSPFLNTVSESNRNLRKLDLEDMNLADCHSEIIHLLDNRMLEELSLKDCRLLEKCREKEDFLRQLVNSVKRCTTLHSLNLSQNRLAKNVTVLGELFTGSVLSTVKKLDISSNFIQPPELEKFGMLLETNCLPQQLTLDLRCNPLDRDPGLRDKTLYTLGRVCRLIADQWNSRDTMADHLSVM